MVSLPVMQCPPPVESPEMERIRQIYRELPAIFAKEIARRQAHGINGNAKRERTEEPTLDSMHKRRDTGETKANAPFATIGAGLSTPHPPSQSMQVPNPIANISAGPVARIGSPAMPPPPVPPGAMGANEAQIASIRARQQQQLRAAAMQQQADGRQMSPPTGMSSGVGMGGMSNVAGPSSMTGVSQLSPQQMALLQGMGPQAVQNFQALQTPGHPFVQYLTQQIPNFPQLPLQEKLQKMQMAQVSRAVGWSLCVLRLSCLFRSKCFRLDNSSETPRRRGWGRWVASLKVACKAASRLNTPVTVARQECRRYRSSRPCSRRSLKLQLATRGQ